MKPRVAVTATVVVVVMLLGGCFGGGVKIAARAADDAGRAVGVGASTIEASGEDVTRLASQANVTGDVIRGVAGQLDTQPTWQKSVRGVRNAYQLVPDEVREVATGVVCDVVNGEITTYEQLENAIYSHAVGLTEEEFKALVQAIGETWQALREAFRSENAEVRAAAVLTCFAFENVG